MSCPLIKIRQGELRGKSCEDYDGNVYFSFLGIPYAKPPLGDLRFKAPQPPEPWAWEGIRDATKDAAGCYSGVPGLKEPSGSEDCLFLNVFTKQIPLNTNELKPVMVWIHGGGFTSGSNNSSNFGPDFLICEDVVIVTINYRLGILGFLSLKDPNLGVPGNAGLKDMVMALKWVKNNIEKFNGDPNNVTIFGGSAGAAAVHLLVLSPMAKCLFHKAIGLSGSATNCWAYGTIGAERIATILGHDGKNEEEIFHLLRDTSKEDLFEAQCMLGYSILANVRRYFGPVVEKFNPNEESFLPDDPVNIIKSCNYNKVPLIMGYNSREGLIFKMFKKLKNFSYKIETCENLVPFTLGVAEGSPLSKNIGNKIMDFYFGNNYTTPNEFNDNYVKLQSDNFFSRDIYNTVINHVKTSKTPVYLYRLSIDTELNLMKKMFDIKESGTCHGDDIYYIFKTDITPKIRAGSIEEMTVKRVVKYFTKFAKYGDPNPENRNDLFPVIWKPVTKDDVNYLDINENLTIGYNPDHARMKFWDSIFDLVSNQ